jgi:proteasome lid subunit RPN8/RPN11
MKLNFDPGLYNSLILLCKRALPKKAFGILAGKSTWQIEEIYPFSKNLRISDPQIDLIFKSYGKFYHDIDRGFWADPQEQIEILQRIEEKEQKILGVYHSHRCTCAIPSMVDIDLHFDPKVLMVIVSLVDPESAELRAFMIKGKSYQEIPVSLSSLQQKVL